MKKNTQKKEEEIAKAIERIEAERNEMNEYRRFGYFSIPYPATIGDRSYSNEDKNKNHKIVDRKVIVEKRNIYVKPLLKGKSNDVYFSPVEPMNDEQIDKVKELNKKEKEDYLKVVQKRKEKKAETHFKPSGPQDLIGYYSPGETSQRPEPTGSLIIEKDKKRFIMDGHKVKTERRGIYTNPPKLGKLLTPNDYFSFYGTIEELQEKMKSLGEQEIKDRVLRVKERKENKSVKAPFHPASLKKCDPFSSNFETYGLYDDDEKARRIIMYKEYKKKGNPRYAKSLPRGAVKHDQPFRASKLISTGRDSLFNDDLYKLPEIDESQKPKILSVKERKEKEAAENKNKRMPFTYNKLMKTSNFAPPISSFISNLKKEFPQIKFH